MHIILLYCIAGTATGPSVCRGESSANPLEPVGSVPPCSVQPRLQSLTMECIGSIVVPDHRAGWGALGHALTEHTRCTLSELI